MADPVKITPGPEPRAWQRMLSGRRLDLINPSPADIKIEDIAHGLARVARWNGQTTGDHALSVAQHSMIVEEIFATRIRSEPEQENLNQWRLAALLHDAPEYVIGDMISPFKTVLGSRYQQFENGLQQAIHLRFSLPATLPQHITDAIKSADRVSAYFEAVALAGFDPDEARILFGHPKNLSSDLLTRMQTLTPLPAPLAQRDFMSRFAELSHMTR